MNYIKKEEWPLISKTEKDSDPGKDWGVVTSDYFKVNNKDDQRIWVEDNFYEDPDKVRSYALAQTYWDKNHGGVGWRTRKQFIFDGVKEKFESIMQKKISNWTEKYSICGVFQAGFCDGGKVPPVVYHCDTQQWAAMVFLTPDAPVEMGTKIHRNKKSKVYHSSQTDNVLDYFPNQKTFCDGTLFEDVDVIGNVYNRLVIFDAQCIHASSGYFGSCFNTGRLWQMFFFDTHEK
jgi:alpha-mannosidase